MGILVVCDNCKMIVNKAQQEDLDKDDGLGDVCDDVLDGDGRSNNRKPGG